MKKSRTIAAAAMVSAALLALATPVATCAETAETNPQDIAASTAAEPATGVQFGGSVRTDDRVSTDSTPQLTYQEYRLQLTGDARPTDKTRFHAEAWVRSSGTSSPAT
ncbi:MAG: hypothetical protein ABSG63_22075, partial [Spirochaetia bacterium]